MKRTILLILSFIAVTNTVLSQTSAEKYFHPDSISFIAEHCSKTVVKKKEVKSCYSDSTKALIKNKTFIERTYWTSNREAASMVTGDLFQVDFIMSKISTKTDNGPDALPVVSYLLKLEGKYDTWPFTTTSKYLKSSTSSSLYLPFATYEDAAAAKKYLESLVGIDWGKKQ